MGKLVEISNGIYYLEVKVAGLTVEKHFIEVEKPEGKEADNPKPDGFYLYIPDVLLEEK